MAKDTDRFGNRFAPNLSYARGTILAATSDDFTKLQRAWAIIRERGPESIYVFTGLDHSLPMEPEDLRWADDEIAPALYWDRLKALTLEHLGGTSPTHDIAVFNRLTGATLATHLTLVTPGDAVIGVSVSHSHPSVLRAAAHVGARFTDTSGLEEFKRALDREPKVAAAALKPIFGARLHETPTTAQLYADDVLEIAMERGGVKQAPIVPFEASAAFCMLMLRDHNMLTVHFVGMPPGGADILFKFIPPETLARFGGPGKFAAAVDASLTTLGSLLKDPAQIRALLLGGK